MSERNVTEIVRGPGVIEFDAERIAEVILLYCDVTPGTAARCANRILEYLIETFDDARNDDGRRQ